MPETRDVICPHCHHLQKLKAKPVPWWRRLLRACTASGTEQTCEACGEKISPDARPPQQSAPAGLRTIECECCQALTNYRPVHSGRTIRCASCSHPLILP
ncbi:MAG: hypothetical protein D6794_10435 [Deltaproteobacteria bacterium]|nr:MAG: hypothetical protein D6794_10435 [Deltaproteobacteria bacterium]